jgi:uncharacterized protein DUF5906
MPNAFDSQDNVDELEEKLNQEKAKRKQKLAMDALEEFITENELYYISKQHKFFLHVNDTWTHMIPDALKYRFPIMGDKNVREALPLVLAEHDRVFDDLTYTFEPDKAPHKLNLLDTSGWLKPSAGEYHWLFDTLTYSMGGAKPDNIEHIERLIAYKYEHPNCPTLPALVIHGEGSVGKNLLVEQVLKTLFGGAATAGNVDIMLGAFNTPMKGMIVVLIDEASAKKVNHDKLKNMLGSSTLWLNEKGLLQYEVPAIAWIIISSNKHEGGIFLDRSSADRRYSVCYVETGKDIHKWIAEKLGMNVEEAKVWVKEHAPSILTDKKQVSHWIHALLKKYEGQSQPLALHGEDFERMMDVQQPVEESLIPAVFSDPRFTHINRQTLYLGYQILCKREGRFPMSSRYLYAKVRAWLKANKPEIDHEDYQQRQDDSDGHVWIWSLKSLQNTVIATVKTDNDDKYVEDRFNPKWVGPEGR